MIEQLDLLDPGRNVVLGRADPERCSRCDRALRTESDRESGKCKRCRSLILQEYLKYQKYRTEND